MLRPRIEKAVTQTCTTQKARRAKLINKIRRGPQKSIFRYSVEEILKARKIWLIFGRNFVLYRGLPLAEHCLSRIFITNPLRRAPIAMQGAQNIAKILLLP